MGDNVQFELKTNSLKQTSSGFFEAAIFASEETPLRTYIDTEQEEPNQNTFSLTVYMI